MKDSQIPTKEEKHKHVMSATESKIETRYEIEHAIEIDMK